MDEGRKRVLLIAASILAARKLVALGIAVPHQHWKRNRGLPCDCGADHGENRQQVPTAEQEFVGIGRKQS